MLYKDWLCEWLKNYLRHSVKPKTYEQYREIVIKRLIPTFGCYEMTAISPLQVQKYIIELLQNGNLNTGEGLSVNSVSLIISVIQSSFETALVLGIVNENSMDKIKRPKKYEKQITCFSSSEQKMIEQAVLNDKRDKMIGIMICLYTGLRIGELLSLEWTDIDFNKAELKISKTCYDTKDENGKHLRVTNAPKTLTSLRTIPIPKQLLPYLKTLQKQSKGNYVISNNSEYISIRSYQRSFELLLKKLNIPHRGFHSLRHTFATRALECGMDVKTLSEVLGHKNPTVTLCRYAHSMTEHKRDMMNQLGRLI
ncbi:MAG: site-specific integrase [Clostridia bacterium]|nr:site-specific integrase [Clostridia bacterium]